MEKPIPPNPDTMTDEEFDKWLEAEFIWESEQIEKALFPDGIPEDTSTPEEKEAAWQEFVAKAKEKAVHRGACEDWTHGEPVEVWRDENHILCIRYADGKWWHYSFKPTGLEWW